MGEIIDLEDKMSGECRICGRSFKALPGLKRHLLSNHGCSYVDYVNKYKKDENKKNVLKNETSGNNITVEGGGEVIDLQNYKEENEQLGSVKLLTELEVEKWGRLSAEKFSIKQAINMRQIEAKLLQNEHVANIQRINNSIKELNTSLKNDVDPEYEKYMHQLSDKYKIPRDSIGIHADTRVIWDLRESKEVPIVQEKG